MTTVNVHQAKTQLSKLFQQVGGRGNNRHCSGWQAFSSVGADHAKPKGLKLPGAMRGQISIRDDFDLLLDGLFNGSLEPSGREQPRSKRSLPPDQALVNDLKRIGWSRINIEARQMR